MKSRPGTAGSAALSALLLLAMRPEARPQGPPGAWEGWSARVPVVPSARQWFVSPEGKSGNAGTRDSPWDLASTLSGARPVEPGDVVWVRGGAYRGKLELKLRGSEAAPIHVRAFPGERATLLDSGLNVSEPASFVWVWDLEISGSTPVEKRVTPAAGSHPADLPGTSGLEVRAGKGMKFLNLWIHDNVLGGVGWWVGSTDGEIHGAVIAENGWRGPDRGHGHSIYAQNRDGLKTVSSCILSVPHDGSYTMHAYGSERAFVDGFLLEDNIAHGKGPFLVGGGRPSRNIRVLRNLLHGVDLRLGYGAENEDCEVRGNVVARGTIAIRKFRAVVDEGNLRELPARKAVLIPNRYDPRRAHLAVYNGERAPRVEVEVGHFLRSGARFRLLDPRDLHGKPVLEGAVEGPRLSVPVAGEFAAFVLLTEAVRVALELHPFPGLPLLEGGEGAGAPGAPIVDGGFSGLARAQGAGGGALDLWTITDRGPNVMIDFMKDPTGRPFGRSAKLFPLPGYNQAILRLRLLPDRTVGIVERIGLKRAGRPTSGLPSSAADRPCAERAFARLTDRADRPLPPSPEGYDFEGIHEDLDRGPEERRFWTCDEYGPSIQLFDGSGNLLREYAPGASRSGEGTAESPSVAPLPAVLRHRMDNRGFEGIAGSGGHVFALMQSPLDPAGGVSGEPGHGEPRTRLHRLLRLETRTGSTAMFAYRHHPDPEALGGSHGEVRVGDLTALDGEGKRFLVLEYSGRSFAQIHRITLSPAATVLEEARGVDYEAGRAPCVPVEKELVADLTAALATLPVPAKPEGLVALDPGTILVLFDNDYGLAGDGASIASLPERASRSVLLRVTLLGTR